MGRCSAGETGALYSGRHKFTDRQDAEPKLREWQRWYNHERFFLALAAKRRPRSRCEPLVR